MTDYSKMPLWMREIVYKENNPDLPEPQYAILWEDPLFPDEPARVTTPSPEWLALAMHGGILPPVEVYHELAADEAQPGFKRHTRGYLLHDTPPVSAMTEEEAMEYLTMKDIPPRVWRDYRGNRVIMKIVPRSSLPTERTFRNSWQVSQPDEALEAA